MGKLLRRGDRGPDVKKLQHALNARPYLNLREDGVYGPKTESAVRAFQLRAGLTADGIAGPRTHAALELRVLVAETKISVALPQAQSGGSSPAAPAQPNPPTGGAAAPPDAGSGASVVHQVSAGSQVSLAPWFSRPSLPAGSPQGSIWAGTISYALVYRTAGENAHLEFSVSPQVAINSRVQASDPRWTLQVSGQVTFADLVASKWLHLISPFVQASIAASLQPGSSFGGGFSLGNQISFDLVPDRLQISVQPGVAAQWNNLGTRSSTFSVAPQFAAGATVQF